VPMVFSLALILATFVLVVVDAHFNLWDYFSFTVFKSFQSFGLGVRVSIMVGVRLSIRVSVRLVLGLGLTFYV